MYLNKHFISMEITQLFVNKQEGYLYLKHIELYKFKIMVFFKINYYL